MSEAEWRTLLRPLLRQAMLEEAITAVTPLTGGVSSDIVRVDLADGKVVCAKRALARLKVASLWEAPLERNHYEVAWLRLARSVVPTVAPQVLAEDAQNGIALLQYLPPADYAIWKAELLGGRLRPGFAESVAASLSSVHTATWESSAVAAQFATDDMFDALRLSPYLRTLAERTPDLADHILAVVEVTARTKLALVHGDVSPKNILISRRDGYPVFLDAECAWFGDPAFDAAFCINHLLLKAVHLPAIRHGLIDAAHSFSATWLAGIPADAAISAENRLIRLLPCLLLARVDGKSPVEYLLETERAAVRGIARALIARPPATAHDLGVQFKDLLASQDL